MAPPRTNDAAPTTNPPLDNSQQTGFSPIQAEGYSLQSSSGAKTAGFESPSASDVVSAVGVSAIKGYLTQNYSQAVMDILGDLQVIDPNSKPVNYDNGLRSDGSVKTLKDGGGKGVEDKLGPDGKLVRSGDQTSALSALANQLSSVAGVVAKDLADFFQRPTTGEAKKPDIIRAPHETDTTKLNTLENQKRERLDKSIKEVTENLPESLGKTKDLVENVHGLLTGQDVDANTLSTLRDLSQAAAAELGENGSKSSREALDKLSEELRQDYGIDMKIDENGLSMSDGIHSLSVDSKGNVIASSMPRGGEDASSHPENAEAMLKALRHSFNMNSHNQNQMIKSIPTHIPEVKGAPMEKPNPNTKGGRIIVNADPSKAGPAQTGRQTPDTTSNHDEITRMLEMYRKMQAKE